MQQSMTNFFQPQVARVFQPAEERAVAARDKDKDDNTDKNDNVDNEVADSDVFVLSEAENEEETVQETETSTSNAETTDSCQKDMDRVMEGLEEGTREQLTGFLDKERGENRIKRRKLWENREKELVIKLWEERGRSYRGLVNFLTKSHLFKGSRLSNITRPMLKNWVNTWENNDHKFKHCCRQ